MPQTQPDSSFQQHIKNKITCHLNLAPSSSNNSVQAVHDRRACLSVALKPSHLSILGVGGEHGSSSKQPRGKSESNCEVAEAGLRALMRPLRPGRGCDLLTVGTHTGAADFAHWESNKNLRAHYGSGCYQCFLRRCAPAI